MAIMPRPYTFMRAMATTFLLIALFALRSVYITHTGKSQTLVRGIALFAKEEEEEEELY